jgi:DNA modification methylase
VAIARGWAPEKKTAYTIADNQAGLLSGWDENRLGLQLADLSKLETVDVSRLGFTKPVLARLMPAEIREGQTDPDAAAPAEGSSKKTPISRPGDLWMLGKHRLLCGDATNADHVALACGELRPLLMVTDPPYGVNYEPGWRNKPDIQSSLSKLGNRSIEARVENDHRADWSAAWNLFAGDVAYVWHAALFADVVIASLESHGFRRRAQIIWRKPHFVIGRGDYHWQHEPCWYVVRDGGKAHWNGDRAQSSVWDIANNMGFRTQTEGADARVEHGTQKPVECMRRPIENNSRPGDAVYEPFAGSGTTIIAAEQTGRVCAALEIKPAYVDLAVARWEAFTGLGAILVATGQDRLAVSIERRKRAKKAA